jgi:hypothetical protein
MTEAEYRADVMKRYPKMNLDEALRQDRMRTAREKDQANVDAENKWRDIAIGDISKRPEFEGLTGPEGKLLSQYTLTGKPDVGFTDTLGGKFGELFGAANLDKSGIDAIKARALATGQSPWASLMLEKQGVEQAARGDELSRLLSAGTAKAYGDLGVRGGMRSGSRERVATKGLLDSVMKRQDLARQGQADRLGILTTDEGQKLDLLKMLPGAQSQAFQSELNKANLWGDMANVSAGRKQALDLSNRDYSTGIDKTNLATLIGDKQSKSAFDMSKWQEQMKAWAADRQATATEEAGKK